MYVYLLKNQEQTTMKFIYSSEFDSLTRTNKKKVGCILICHTTFSSSHIHVDIDHLVKKKKVLVFDE